MGDANVLPGVAARIVQHIEGYRFREALAALDDPRDGGALAAPLAGLLRARALSGLEKWHASYQVLGEVRGMRDLGTLERVEAQVRTARVLRFASPLVDYALDIALAAARSGVRAGGAGIALAVDAHLEAALLFGRKRCKNLAREQLEAAAKLGENSSWVHSTRADLAITFDDRVAAKEALDALVATLPSITNEAERVTAERYARLGLARLYTILGEFDSAAVEIGKLGNRPASDVAVPRSKWRLYAAQGKWRDVADALAQVLEACPDGDSSRGMMLERASALYRAGEIDAARDAWTKIAASGNGDPASRTAARNLEKSANEGAKRTRLVAFPSVTQLRNHCGPASVELCLRFFGTSADQVAVAREIKHPDGGTPVHRMRAYMDAAGFVTRRIEADLDRLRKILDAGVPVILEEDYSTTRHVAVAIGYDDRREILEVQDPMTHEIRETPYEELPKLREFSNHGALVAVPKDRADLLAKLDEAGAVECVYISTTDRAWEAFDQNRYEDADRLATEAIELHEAYELAWVLRFVRAREQFEAEGTDENKGRLIGVLNAITHLWPDDEWPQQFLGRVYALEDRSSDALAAFERARDRDPDDANNWCSIGDQHLALGDQQAARKAFEEALQRDPGHVRSNENLANVAFELGDVSLAALLNSCARELCEENPFNHYVHARILGKRGELNGALTAYERAIELRPESSGYAVERAKLLARRGDVDEALASIEKRLEAAPQDGYLLTNLADLAYTHGRYEQCLAACAKLREVDPNSPTPDAIGGAALGKQGKLDEGLSALRGALRKRPVYGWVHREIGRIFAQAGRHEDAIPAFAAAAGLSNSPEMIFALADALTNGGHAGEAGFYARRAVQSLQLDEDQVLRAAEILAAGDGLGSAHGFLGNVGEENPRDMAVARAHARFLLEKNWYPGAASKVLSRLSELAPEDPFVLAQAADQLMDASMKDEPQGEALFVRAIEAAPKLVSPRRLYARQMIERGRYADALAMLEPLAADIETTTDRVNALLGLRRDDEAKSLIDAFAESLPEAERGQRKPLDFTFAKVNQRWEEALALATEIGEGEGELEDDGELGKWEKERFDCLVALGRSEEAYEFGVAQCADAEDKGLLAYKAMARDDHELGARLGQESFEEDETEDYAVQVLAWLADVAGDTPRAKALWLQMREHTDWHIHDENLGRLAVAAGELEEAKQFAERAVAAGHACPTALHLRATVRLLEGDRDGAKADALRAKGAWPVARRGADEHIAAMLVALDDSPNKEEAVQLYERYLEREKLSPSDRQFHARVRAALGV